MRTYLSHGNPMPQPTISDAITAWAAHYGVNASNEALTALATLVSTAYRKGIGVGVTTAASFASEPAGAWEVSRAKNGIRLR